MSMKIADEAQRSNVINIYNKNRTYAEKNFERLANGMKVVGAGDNSSAWAISERMRHMIRSLSQDEQNVQNGSALVKTAERAIDQIVENLRTMKELAIDAANDSNTNEDRAVLQKEIDQRLAVINDIAHDTQYNGRYLLDGTWTDEGIRAYKEYITGDGIDKLLSNFAAGESTVSATSLKSYGGSSWFSFDADVGFQGQGSPHMAIMDFSGMQRKHGYAASLHNQGFTILCGGCNQYINVRFDASKTADESDVDRTANTLTIDNVTHTNNIASEFFIGIKGVTNSTELANALFEGVQAANSVAPSGNEVVLDRTRHLITLGKTVDGKLYIKQSEIYSPQSPGGVSMLFKARLIKNDAIGDLDDIGLPEIPIDPLWVQHGTQDGQRIHLYINDMSTSSMGLDGLSVRTSQDANSAIAKTHTAIEYALNEATNMGAYMQRLETLYVNVTTMSENVQASDSTIRDADMAKEMTDYMRYNILGRSSQAMLAQVNRNEENVLGLLR